MAAATKNKRGRPRKHELIENAMFDKEPRTAQNIYFATLAIKELGSGAHDDFFVTNKGNIRRQGIAEQIGRLYESGAISAEQGRELLETCKKDYKSGISVKEIERRLRQLRKIL